MQHDPATMRTALYMQRQATATFIAIRNAKVNNWLARYHGVTTMLNHLAAITSGEITGSNIIGLRKAFNAVAQFPYHGCTSPKATQADIDAYLDAIHTCKPSIIGDWLDSGVAQLTSKRYAKRWNAAQAAIIADIAAIRLVNIGWIDDLHCFFIYQAIGHNGDNFNYHNIAWQSNGDGPTAI